MFYFLCRNTVSSILEAQRKNHELSFRFFIWAFKTKAILQLILLVKDGGFDLYWTVLYELKGFWEQIRLLRLLVKINEAQLLLKCMKNH